MQTIPLAAKLRPKILEDFVGQTHLLAEGKPLRQAILTGKLHSMILWGPPGTGKTTLARLVAEASNAYFINLSAVFSGVKDIREAMQKAHEKAQTKNQATLLFIDEVHRFNKSQQDAFLPFVEEGVITFIGATTENPSFEINNALLSRARVYVLNALDKKDILQIIERALSHPETGYQNKTIHFEQSLREQLALASDGDARQALTMLEIILAHSHSGQEEGTLTVQPAIVEQVISGTVRRFDKGGDTFYDQISALHKAVRGSSPDGALYWLGRMLDGGCDPLYIARRIIRMSTEDIGNADPRALEVALNACAVQERLGSPEGELALAQAVVYMAVAPKSNAVYTAFKAAMQDARQNGSLPVPIHLRNAPTRLMKNLNHGRDYRYDHDEPNAFAAGQTYFPENMKEKQYYYPVPRGLESKIKEKLEALRPPTVLPETSEE